MSFLHARYTRLAPLFLNAHFVDEGLYKGISMKPGHVAERSVCVERFLDVFGEDTLVSSGVSVGRFAG